MPDNHNPAQPAKAESMASTTEELLRLLNQQPKGLNGDDSPVDNPELEQLFGSLSKGIEQGIDDTALGIPMGEPLTLEALVANLGQSPALGDIPAAQTVRASTVACPKCGAANPATTLFCGMCGHGLGGGIAKASGNELKAAVATTELPTLAHFGRKTGLSLAFKTALLGVLMLGLAGVVYQEQLWRMPLLVGFISNLHIARTSPPAANPAAEVAPPTVKLPEPVHSELPAVRTPVTVVRAGKTGPSTVVRRNLPEPTQLASGPLAQEIPLPALPPPAPAAEAATEAAAPPPVEKVPAVVPQVSAPEPKPARTSQISPGVLISKVNPQYPPAARAARVQGAVVMHAIIGTDGSIQQLRVISGNPLLVNAAMDAVKKWRYRPYVLDGKAVEGETDITVHFRGE